MTNTQLELNQKVIEKVIKKYSGVSPYGYKNYQKKWTKFIDNSHIDNTLIVERDMYEFYKYHALDIAKRCMFDKGTKSKDIQYYTENDDRICDFWATMESEKINIWEEYPELESQDLRILLCFQELAVSRGNHFEGITWKIRERICLDKYEGYTAHRDKNGKLLKINKL